MEKHGELAAVLRGNIEAMRDRRDAASKRASSADRLAQHVTDFAGSMSFVALHLVLFGGWILVNVAGPSWLRFDPSLVILAMAASVEAIFLSTFVLISQNRLAAAEDSRAELDLQINLLAEHEVTRLIDLVSRVAKHLKVEDLGSDLDELRQDVAADAVLDRIDQSNEETT